MTNSYSEYKESNQDWLGAIPYHWELRKMKYSFSERSEKGFPSLPMLAATQNHGVIKKSDYENRTVEATKALDTLKLVEVGDFVISLRSFQGGVEYSHERGIISPAYTVLRPIHIRGNYFKYFGKSPVFIQLLKSMVTGIREGQNIDYGKLRENLIPIPPKDEQDAIANYLDAATAKIDEVIAHQQRMIDLLNERKQVIIDMAALHGLNPDVEMIDSGNDWIGLVPAHWRKNTFRYLFKTRTGITFTKAQLEEEGEPVISYGQIHSKDNWGASVNPELIRHIPALLTKGKEGALAIPGDFLFADTSEDFEGCGNNVFIDSEPVYAGYHTILAKKNNEEYGPYLAYLFTSTGWRGQLRSMVNGVKVYSITQTILNSANVVLPPVDEQKEIADYITERVVKLDEGVKRHKEFIKVLQERKQIIINDVVTGKVKVV